MVSIRKIMEYIVNEVGADQFIDKSFYQVFGPQNINLIRNKVAAILEGVHPENKKIVVSDEVIKNVLSSIYNNDYANLRDINDNTIGIITSYIRTEFAMIEQNNKLTPWVQKYGSNGHVNESGLSAHSKITTREKRPFNPEFNMRY